MLTITYEKLLEIYFQNPQFGYYFLVLTSQRLLENISRLEAFLSRKTKSRSRRRPRAARNERRGNIAQNNLATLAILTNVRKSLH